MSVLPVAIQKRISVCFVPRTDARIYATSDQANDAADFPLQPVFVSEQPGHWSNYIRAAAHALLARYTLRRGLDAHVTSDLPAAAGLSSSSALLIAFSLALLRANDIEAIGNELLQLLPDAEQLVGTRGGAMDHVAILESQAGCATFIKCFVPLSATSVPIPGSWRFLVAHSLVHAEKSGIHVRAYNAIRDAGDAALAKLGFSSYSEAISTIHEEQIADLNDELERNVFRHVYTEARRVKLATEALHVADLQYFGQLLLESHRSLRDLLRVSLPTIDELVDCAMEAGAHGARLTGAGFGGCVLCLCNAENVERVRRRLMETYYGSRPDFDSSRHLFIAEPSDGVLRSSAC
jgi:galactokinase